MTPTAWRYRGGLAERTTPQQALAEGGDLAWIHLEGAGADLPRWLEADAGLDPIVAAALTAAETRPRCDAIGDGALVNLRGLAANPDEAVDSLASIRLFATRGRVISVSRIRLSATAEAEAAMAAGRLTDPGDLVTDLAVAITRLLDPEVASLGDALDACELELDARESWRFRRSVAAARDRLSPLRPARTRGAGAACPDRVRLDRRSRPAASWRSCRPLCANGGGTGKRA